jgi:hypothetical protein
VVTHTVSAEVAVEEESGPLDPAEAVKLWREWRAGKRYRLLEKCIEPEQSVTFIDTLMGIDLVLAANEEARQAIAGVLGEHRTEPWDLSSLGQSLGLFSERMEIIDVERDKDTATITFQVGDTFPLETAKLRMGPDGWLYAPGVGPGAMPARFQDLAAALSEVARTIRRDHLSAERINQEYRLRIRPRLQAIERTQSGVEQ